MVPYIEFLNGSVAFTPEKVEIYVDNHVNTIGISCEGIGAIDNIDAVKSISLSDEELLFNAMYSAQGEMLKSPLNVRYPDGNETCVPAWKVNRE